MDIGCFALVEPFLPLAGQFQAIRKLGITHADLTDNHEGGSLGVEFGFSASLSLDEFPGQIRGWAAEAGVTLTAFCAHANLLDPVGPATYGTHQIIKAIRLAHHLGLKQVITTEGDPRTDFGHGLTEAEQILVIREKLYHPVRWARELGIELLLEPHGPVTGRPDRLEQVVEAVDLDGTVHVNLDTGNSWLAGADPLEYVRRFGSRIRHVHWKDLGPEFEARRGSVFGCGMGTLPLGDGVVGIPEIVRALRRSGFDGPTTLEVAGPDAVRESAARLRAWWDEPAG